MTKQIPSYLRLVTDAVSPEVTQPPVEDDALARLCRSFRQAFGLQLSSRPGPIPADDPNVLWAQTLRQDATGDQRVLCLGSTDDAGSDTIQRDFSSARELAQSLSEILSQLNDTRRVLWQREAELAVGIPVVTRPDEDVLLASRLEAILQGAADGVDAEAAALYLLDDATSQLKLRASWGLPVQRLLEPARPLRGAVADLEALTGHAVVLEDVSHLPHWRVPEDFASAACVPVATPSTPLGTLWIFCRERRDFDPRQMNLLEIVAGRISSDLEREILIAQAQETKVLYAQARELSRTQDNHFPLSAPLSDTWDVAGRSLRAGTIGGDFYDWHSHSDGALVVALGSALGEGLRAAMVVTAISALVKSYGEDDIPSERLMEKVNLALWSGTAGDCFGSLFHATLHEADGQIQYCSAGPLGAIVVRPQRPSSITQGALPLGTDPDAVYRTARQTLQVGDALVVVSDAVRKTTNKSGEQLGEAAIADAVRGALSLPPEELADVVLQLANDHAEDAPTGDYTVLVAKRQQ